MNSEQRQQIRGLIKKYSDSGTESLIAFVAEADGMLVACQELLQGLNAEDSTGTEWLQRECCNESVTFHAFLQEIENIAALFQPSRSVEDHHATLGVSATAGVDEIKQAYRTLSRRYHPDTASPPYRDNPEKFIAINQAYQALLSGAADNEKGEYIQQEKQWRKRKERRISPRQWKKVFTSSMGILIILVVISVIASVNYKKRAMLAGFQASRGAFIPPAKRATDVSAGKDENPPAERPVANFTTTESPERNLVAKVQPDLEGDPSIPKDASKAPVNTTATSAIPVQEKPTGGLDEGRSHPVKVKQVALSSTEAKDANILANKKLNSAVPVNNIRKTKGKERIVSEQPGPAKVSTVARHASEQHARVETDKPALTSQTPTFCSEQSDTIGPDVAFKIVLTEKEMRLAATNSEGAALDATSPPKAVNQNQKETNVQTRVDRFFADYIEAYEKRNVILFSKFFEGEAEENGKPFISILPTYLDLFATTQHITLQVEDRTWRLVDGMVAVDGRFKVLLEYNDSRKITGSGPIHFLLAENGNELLVKKMDYVINIE